MAKGLWGGRFKKEMHPLLKQFSFSLAVDQELLDSELRVNSAWAEMLAETRLISKAESKKLLRGIRKISQTLKRRNLNGKIESVEDIHTLIQNILEKEIGETGKKIHTARSRNDLVVTSTRVYLKEKIQKLHAQWVKLESAFVKRAEKEDGVLLPGFTHLKKAQPVLLSHQFLAYAEMLDEDRLRLLDCFKRVDVLVLGSAALAGSGLKVDQDFLARKLGFSKIAANSLTATSDRAFITEFLSVLAMLWMHLSRFAEDMILWNTEAFGWLDLDDAFATGSSLMPQKKNPDVFELIRGRAGVIFGHLQAALTLQKGLPLAYNRDLQEDKPGLFDAIHKTEIVLELLPLVIQSMKFNREAMEKALDDDGVYATDLLDYLIAKGLTHKDGHAIVGAVVRYGLQHKKRWRDFSIPEWRAFSPKFGGDVCKILDPVVSVNAKKTSGSTHPGQVRKQIARLSARLRQAAV